MTLVKLISRSSQLIILVLASSFVLLAAGEVDLSFPANITTPPQGRVLEVLIQPDGKILIAGPFLVVKGVVHRGIARLNADGTIDTSFNPPDFAGINFTVPVIETIALQSDGKIVVGGQFAFVGSASRSGLVRLNANGSVDNTFPDVFTGGSPVVNDIIVYPDDRILIGGSFFTGTGPNQRNNIARLEANGNVDISFNYTGAIVRSLLLLPDGKFVAGSNSVQRYNADGTPDAMFQSTSVNSNVLDMERQADGKVLVGGGFGTVNGFNRIGLYRVNTDGTVDTTFPDVLVNSTVTTVTLDSSGRIMITGGFSQTWGNPSFRRIARLNADGTLDPSFNYTSHTFNIINDLAIQSDGQIVVGGDSTAGLNPQNPLTRVSASGVLDATFNVPITGSGWGFTVQVLPDDKFYVGGQFSGANGMPRSLIARFNADGTLDPTFVGPNYAPTSQLFETDVQPDGKLLVVGSMSNAQRLNTNGSVDITIPDTQVARDIKVLPNGKILIAGGNLRRFSSTGAFETTLATLDGGGVIYKMALQPDGKVVIVGTFTQVNGQARGRIARINADGSLDTGFNPPGGANSNVNTVVLQADGKILIGGDFTGVNFDNNKKYVARLNSDGSLDAGFGPVLNAPVLGLKVQPDGKVLIGGSFSGVNGIARAGIARLNQDGSTDLGFGVSGTNSTVWGIDQQSDGKIIYTGQFYRTDGFSTPGIGRLLNASAPTSTLFDYDGDGKADVSVFRPSENRWYVFRSSDSTVTQTVFAIAGDVPVPADYDGDQKTDIAIYRPSSGAWWYLSSLNGAQINVNWGGEAGDVPRPSDFDGDGKSDFVFFRPTNNTWYRINSAGTVSNITFGLAGDKPVRGDFDGDGKSDVAIYRPSTGDWWYQSSINGAQLAVRWGISTDIPAPADFDGDGKTDFAVYRPSTGVWYVINSSNGSFLIGPFGISEDKPVPADYDGDGKAELAVFRPSTGIWYQLRTNSGFFAMQFGIATDTPTPNAFVP